MQPMAFGALWMRAKTRIDDPEHFLMMVVCGNDSVIEQSCCVERATTRAKTKVRVALLSNLQVV